MRTRSRVSRSVYVISTCESNSSVEPKRFFRRRAPAATPRNRPPERARKLTSRSASPRGKVFRMIASVSRGGMGFSARRHARQQERFRACDSLAKREPLFLSHPERTRNRRVTASSTIRSRQNVNRKLEYTDVRYYYWSGPSRI